MKVWQRILIKLIIFILVVAAAFDIVAGIRANQQSAPQYVINKYLQYLIDNEPGKAYDMLDFTQDGTLTEAEYYSVLAEKKYSLAAGWTLSGGDVDQEKTDEDMLTYDVNFVNAAGETLQTGQFTLIRQSKVVAGLFDSWKVLSGHCMVKNLKITVPQGSSIYLDEEAVPAERLISSQDGKDCYEIPTLLPGKVSLVVRNELLTSQEKIFNPLDGDVEITEMNLKESLGDQAGLVAAEALQNLYSCAAAGDASGLAESLDLCSTAAKKFVRKQHSKFTSDENPFVDVYLSSFTAAPENLRYDTEKMAYAIDLKLSYRYTITTTEQVESGEYDEYWNAIMVDQEVTRSGDNTAEFTLIRQDGQWVISELEIPRISFEE